MKFLIAAIGKAKTDSPEMRLMAEYSKRISGKLAVKEFDIKHSDTSTRIAKESEALLGACKGYDKIIALDERGKDLGSRELANTIANWQQKGASSIAFIIGGADGLSDEVRKSAHLLLAFGRATWPHMMVRAMLTEQIYRAQTITDGHPYHRD